MEFPAHLSYTKSHEWVEISGDTVTLGLTEYAQDKLGDVVFINMPSVGDSVEMGDAFAEVESVKAVSEIYSPVTATVSEINESASDSPESVNSAPYETWLCRFEGVTQTEELLTAEEYKALTEREDA